MTDTNRTYKPSESKREEFRKYLERTGVMDALTKVLVNLYEEIEKPEDALEFIRERLATMAGIETYKELKDKLSEAKERIQELEQQIQGVDGEKKESIPSEGTADEQQPPPEEVAAPNTGAPSDEDKSGEGEAAAADAT